MSMRAVGTVLKKSVSEFNDDDALTQAAAIAFYTALGLAPTLLLFLSVSAFLGEDVQKKLLNEIQSLVGGRGAEAIAMVVQSASEEPSSGTISAILGIVTVLVSASGIFAQFQTALNTIWEVKADPEASYWSWVRSRILSIGILFSMLFLLVVSLVISTMMALVLTGEGYVWNAVNFGISVAMFTVLFALIYRYLPDAEMSWRDVWIGALVTAVLFGIGKQLIGLYLGNSSMASSYGAAGSLIVLLVWVYYSATIALFGAEVTQVYARMFGSGIRPAEHAVRDPHPVTTPALQGRQMA